MSDILYLAHRARHARRAGALCAQPRPYLRRAMIEPLIGLAVAIALGVYLVVTLIRPERF